MSHAPVASQDPDDLLLASCNLNGHYPWLDPAQQVPYGHVLYAASIQGRAPAAVASRMAELGYADVEHPETPWPDSIGAEDASLVKREGHDAHRQQWLGAGEPVSLYDLLQAAQHAGRAPADVARRLTALGFRIGGGGSLPETPGPRDVMLICADRKGYGTYFGWGDEVSAGHVLEVAEYLACSPHAAAVRLTALGLRLPYTPEPGDERLLTLHVTYRPHYMGRWSGSPFGHVLTVARETGRSAADVVARLAVLRGGKPGGAVPGPLDDDDLVALSKGLDGRGPWLEGSHVASLPMRHVLRASLVTGRSPASVAERLTELGHPLHEKAELPETADEADIRLLETVDRSYRDGVHLEHVLRSAGLTGRSPADVAARLTALGYDLPDEVEYPDVRGSLAV
ncbi:MULTISPECIES: wHTH domain-containing protein [unclassified Streptomyces]|uniref:wHTH domain-containing protein n=1 Tax=unclassified Streptomyces TaxID=2593676 RepID=UPI00093C8687|nr:hypothetical protein [Streptomyces sp. CB02058]OKI95810.1 hypothetical protein AMK10_09020 [Streptomyces sp. CB02058]